MKTMTMTVCSLLALAGGFAPDTSHAKNFEPGDPVPEVRVTIINDGDHEVRVHSDRRCSQAQGSSSRFIHPKGQDMMSFQQDVYSGCRFKDKWVKLYFGESSQSLVVFHSGTGVHPYQIGETHFVDPKTMKLESRQEGVNLLVTVRLIDRWKAAAQ
jgi:hypothetical protein